ncbi:MAG: ribonuclease HII [Thermoproteota archaeon]
MLVAGVDDAGRGCVLGPLFIAGVMMEESNISELDRLGVKDSKRLSPSRRKILAVEIKQRATKYEVVKLPPKDIDRVVENGRPLHRLNRLEARGMAQVIELLKPEVAYVDASDVSEERFKRHIVECLNFGLEVVSEHKADSRFRIVSAASIVAKVERDAEIERLREKYGELGCGYPVDPRTINFLNCCLEKYGRYPDIVRKSWKTAKRVKRERDSHQSRLI